MGKTIGRLARPRLRGLRKLWPDTISCICQAQGGHSMIRRPDIKPFGRLSMTASNAF
jgi:hypothetical protein